MQSLDLLVLEDALRWRAGGRSVDLVTVVETWGSAPRPAGAIVAIREDGLVSGSVSGGCVETDLIARVQNRRGGKRKPQLLTYGVTRDEAARYGLPCGGTLRLVQEPLVDASWIAAVLARAQAHQLTRRTLDLASGEVLIGDGRRNDQVSFDGALLGVTFGPRWRLLLIGAGQVSRTLAEMAGALDFDVLVCDPREEYSFNIDESAMRWLSGMPDDVVREIVPDAHTAIVALTHDPKLDDMALLEALKSEAFYVGALGSRRNTAARLERMRMFDLAENEIARLHGPVGLHIGSKTPAEIAVSVLAEIVAVKNEVEVLQKKPRLAAWTEQRTTKGVRMQVRDILRSKGSALFTVHPDCLLSQCVITMADEDIGSVVVHDGARLVGMVTFREVNRVLAQRQKGQLPPPTALVGDLRVGEVMVHDPFTVSVDTDLQELRAMMIQRHQRYVPVLDGDVLAGVLSFHDVARAVHEEQSFENRMLKAYISDWPAEPDQALRQSH